MPQIRQPITHVSLKRVAVYSQEFYLKKPLKRRGLLVKNTGNNGKGTQIIIQKNTRFIESLMRLS